MKKIPSLAPAALQAELVPVSLIWRLDVAGLRPVDW